MPELHRICSPAIDALADKAFGALGCEDYGIAIMRGATSWGTHETGILTLPMADGAHDLRIAYDEREAPFVVGPDGQEDTGLAISLADEGDLLACAWARMTSDSPLLGVGVDLASSSDFDVRWAMPPRLEPRRRRSRRRPSRFAVGIATTTRSWRLRSATSR